MRHPRSCQLIKIEAPMSGEMGDTVRQSSREVVHQLRTLAAAEIDSRVHLMRIHVQHLAYGAMQTDCGVLNLKRVSPCHSFSTGHYTQFSNSRTLTTTASAVHSDFGESAQHRAAQMTACISQHPTTQLLYVQPARIAAPAFPTRARTVACNCRNAERKRTRTGHKHSSTTTAHDASQQDGPASQLLGRFSEIGRFDRI